MNGIEITRMLRMIDTNMAENESLIVAEILKYMEENQDALLAQFSEKGEAIIPTSAGDLKITPELLREAEGVAA